MHSVAVEPPAPGTTSMRRAWSAAASGSGAGVAGMIAFQPEIAPSGLGDHLH
ncbi:MAG: hypothetical protein KatS3mg077_3357 [Candidatus Binatia bacterium]|nr:MAG: hypothetical protein KatS3mg077_3357 [Candidatus Binatia bacterium]